jgi:hypothetical protein
MEDKRKLERFELKAPAKIIPMDPGREKGPLSLETRNICAGGAFFHTPHALPEGTKVDVEVVLPLDKLQILKDTSKRVHLKVTGRVLRSEPEGFAVRFDGDYRICQLGLSTETRKREIPGSS